MQITPLEQAKRFGNADAVMGRPSQCPFTDDERRKVYDTAYIDGRGFMAEKELIVARPSSAAR